MYKIEEQFLVTNMTSANQETQQKNKSMQQRNSFLLLTWPGANHKTQMSMARHQILKDKCQRLFNKHIASELP